VLEEHGCRRNAMKERRNAMVERRKYEDREDTCDERQESVNISGSPN
jgi:hypothetical protein